MSDREPFMLAAGLNLSKIYERAGRSDELDSLLLRLRLTCFTVHNFKLVTAFYKQLADPAHTPLTALEHADHRRWMSAWNTSLIDIRCPDVSYPVVGLLFVDRDGSGIPRDQLISRASDPRGVCRLLRDIRYDGLADIVGQGYAYFMGYGAHPRDQARIYFNPGRPWNRETYTS